jgi:hypothetical protein
MGITSQTAELNFHRPILRRSLIRNRTDLERQLRISGQFERLQRKRYRVASAVSGAEADRR